MEEESLKRSTDCVYFLASPFTCKKGAECEYRHSEIARLNPRDCWYWMSGNCLNPTCAFRHPPLEAHNEVSTDAAVSVLNQSAVPATKTTVPCYFYYNGFCSKGDKCSFLHDSADTFASKPNTANTGADAPVAPSYSKISGRSDTGPMPAQKHPSPSEMALITGNGLFQVQEEQLAQLSAIKNVQDQNTFAQTYVPEFEETPVVETMSLQHAEVLSEIECNPSLGFDQSSEEVIDGNTRDEWCESSPGFDVLVGERRKDMPYEDDPEFLYSLDGNDEDREHLFMQQGCVRQTGYDERGFRRIGLYEASQHFNDELRADRGRFSPRRRRDRKGGRNVERKRTYRSGESPIGGYNNVDLRDYLRKRRMTDDYVDRHALRHDLARRRDDRQERRRRHGPIQQLHGRLASSVERNGVRFDRTAVVDRERGGRPRSSHHNGYRGYNGIRLRQSSSEGQPKSYSQREKLAREYTTFAAPKSLAVVDDRAQGCYSKNGSVDFEGPKPLCEILKDKKKTGSGDGTTTYSS